MLDNRQKKNLGTLLKLGTPSSFATYATAGVWKRYPHQAILEAALLRVFRGQTKRLQVSMPPQFGKSMLCSHYFPAWVLGHRPDTRIALASYEADNAEAWGRRVRDTVAEFGSLFGISLDPKSSAANRFNIAGQRGYMVTAGIGGPLNGKAVDLGIIDDPIKNRKEAESPTIRRRQKDWFSNVMETRLSKAGAIILVMTRWHEDDLAGWLWDLEKQGKGERWERVIMPAIAPSQDDLEKLGDDGQKYFGTDPLGRAPGEGLCPDLHPLEKTLKQAETLGAIDFWSLMQQYPFVPKGNYFQVEWFRFWEPESLPVQYNSQQECYEYRPRMTRFEEVLISWDFQYGSDAEKGGSSFTVGQVWGKMGGSFWLLDQVREKMVFTEMLEQAKRLARKWPMAFLKLVEAKAAGPYVVRVLQEKIPGFFPVDPQGDKRVRASAVTHVYKDGNVLLPSPHWYPWVKDEFMWEHTRFPNATNDDQVDAGSQALAHWTRGSVRVHDNKPEGY